MSETRAIRTKQFSRFFRHVLKRVNTHENARIGVGHHFDAALSSKTVLAPDDRPPMISLARSSRCSQCFARSTLESAGFSSGTNCVIGSAVIGQNHIPDPR